MVPSSFMISQDDASRTMPASLAKSTEASVLAGADQHSTLARTRGNMWPGEQDRTGALPDRWPPLIVWARHGGDAVVTPIRSGRSPRKKPSHIAEVFSLVMGPMRRCSSRSSVMARQTSPRPNFAMKLMASGVTFSAARVSRFVLAVFIVDDYVMRPARISSMAVGTSANGRVRCHGRQFSPVLNFKTLRDKSNGGAPI